MKKKLLFIYNAHAGKAHIRSRLVGILDVFAKNGYEVTVAPTQKQGDAAEFVKDREDYFELVVCSGGDGTLDEVVSGMMQCEKKLPIGYIPSGSTNDFAKSLKIPGNMIRAAHTAIVGDSFLYDVGKFNQNAFVYIAAFGLFTDVSYETKQAVKNVLGHMAYVLEGMKRLSSIKSYHLKAVYEDGTIEGDFIFGMVTNSMSVGGFKRITGKNVELDDGMFEVTLIKMPTSPIELNRILMALTTRIMDTECMRYFKTSRITFESRDELPWTLDGEFGGTHRKVEIENMQKALEIKIPPKN